MRWWAYAQRQTTLDELVQLLHRLVGEKVERVFVEVSSDSKHQLADLFVEAKVLGWYHGLVVWSPNELDTNSLTRQVILHQCFKQHIEVFALEPFKDHKFDGLLGLLAQADDSTRRACLSFADLTRNDEGPACSVALVIEEWQQFGELLRKAKVRTELAEGRHSGRAAFGEKPDEEAIVQRILDLHNAGMGYTAVAPKINDEGHKTLTGKPFHPQTVKNYVMRYGQKQLG